MKIKPRAYPVLLFIMLYVIYACVYIGRLNFSMASPALIEMKTLTAGKVGIIGGLFSIFFAIGKLTGLFFADKSDPKGMIFIAAAVCAAANGFIALGPPFWLFCLLWSFNGYAQSVIWGPVLRIVAHSYNEKRLVAVTAFLVTCVAAGSLVGIFLAAVNIQTFGVWSAFAAPGILLCICAVLAALFLPSLPKDVLKKNPLSLWELFADKSLRRMIVPSIAHGAIKDNLNLWIPAFFIFCYGLDLKSVQGFVYAVPAASLAGRFLFAPMNRLCKNDGNMICIASYLACCTSTGVLLITGIPALTASIALAVTAVFAAIINTFSTSVFPVSFKESGNIAAVTGIMDVIIYFGGAATAFIYGFLIEKGEYRIVFGSWTVLCAISAIILWVYKNSETKEKGEKANGNKKDS